MRPKTAANSIPWCPNRPDMDALSQQLFIGLDRQVLERLQQPVILCDVEGRVAFANRPALKLVSRDSLDHLAEAVDQPTSTITERLWRLAGSSQWMPCNMPHFDGQPLKLRASGLRHPSYDLPLVMLIGDSHRDSEFAHLRQMVGQLNQELARNKTINDRLTEALNQVRHLNREIIHRVKNNLGQIAAVVAMRRRASPSPEVQAAMDDIEARVVALRAVHEILDHDASVEWLDGGMLIDELCKQLRRSILPRTVSLETRLDAVELHVKAAGPLALAVNELITNSAKHGFPHGQAGRIYVELKHYKRVNLCSLVVADDGVGIGKSAPTSGFGSQMVRALAQQLGGTLESRPTGRGARWVLQFPLDMGSMANPTAADI